MNIQWYPGHMTKAMRTLESNLHLVDIFIEILDARIPQSSMNPQLGKLAKNKSRIFLLNKSDLAEPKTTARWVEYFNRQGFFAIAADLKQNQKSVLLKLIEGIRLIMSEKVERQKRRGRIHLPTRAMIVGVPNVGKSTLINRLAEKASAKTADKPGVTRGIQWIKTQGGFDLMDTPGVLWPKFVDPITGIRLAITGAISDNILDEIALSEELISILCEINPNLLITRYKLQNDISLHEIGNARGFKIKGGEIDIKRTAIMLLDEFRGGKIGRITLESD